MLFPILFSSTERLRKLLRRFKIQGSYSFELFKFHDFFLVTLGLAVTLQNFPSFRVFFDLKQFTLKCMPFALFNYFSVSYFVLALSSAVTNLPKKNFNFSQRPTIKFHDFLDLENEIRKFHDFYSFP